MSRCMVSVRCMVSRAVQVEVWRCRVVVSWASLIVEAATAWAVAVVVVVEAVASTVVFELETVRRWVAQDRRRRDRRMGRIRMGEFVF